MVKIDLTGMVFGKLLVIKEGDKIKKGNKWICLCECGNTTSVFGNNLRRGTSTSCGCIGGYKIQNGLSVSHKKLYWVWCDIKYRCLNPKHKRYYDYGGRGISICERWLNSFPDFITDMGEKPSDIHSIDRVDNNGNYEPSNCKWSTPKEQRTNQRTRVIWIEHNGEKMVLDDWAKLLNITRSKLIWYLRNHTISNAIDTFLN